MKIVTVVGARPQFIKTAPVIAAANRQPGVQHALVHTGQHYDYAMSKVFFDELSLPAPDYHLEVGSGSHGTQTGLIMERLEPILFKESPDWVLVYGDTNSTLAAALTAAKIHQPVAHVEAGLRSFNKAMPEETNRIVADHVSTILFCPTETAVRNLVREGFSTDDRPKPNADAPLVVNSGDVMYDAALLSLQIAERRSTVLKTLGLARKDYLLATIHRAENTDDAGNLKRIVDALGQVGRPVVFPVHPRTADRFRRFDIAVAGHVRVIEPVGYFDMLMLEKSAAAILTDSGGVQKEAFFFQVPCVTLRKETEWVETVETGWNTIVGTDPGKIVAAACDAKAGKNGVSPYGDGHAAEKIVECLCRS